MNSANILSRDWNLFALLESLLRTRSATRTAHELGLTQPAVSHGLKRLRDEFGDPLFVRSGQGLRATPRAESLGVDIQAARTHLENVVRGPAAFDPTVSERLFRVSTTDYVEQAHLPKLLSVFSRQAPHAQLLSTAARPVLPVRELVEGELDLGIAGFYGALPAGFFQQELFRDDFVVVVSKKHPRIKAKLTLDLFCEEKHALIAPGASMVGIVDEALSKIKRRRHVLVGVSSFTAAGLIVAETDLVLTCPRGLAHTFEKHLSLKLFEAPVKVSPIRVVQVWHERTQKDPAHQWLRRTVAGIFAKS